ncbi:ATP-dependent RNA helicase vasa [Astathelohania contejeani]|uniref:RNA helicase n=1 Tax=Astathelohania contejeani TaxID=164912 RepID=A0ABQ7HXZ6_9MICR|nr:ATP-dependent RNA helicase vasa [Thelohania contejeani]
MNYVPPNLRNAQKEIKKEKNIIKETNEIEKKQTTHPIITINSTSKHKAILSFQELNINSTLLSNILKHYKTPSGIQSHAIPCVLNGENLLCRAPTGTGKTISFLIPIINKLLSSNEAYNNSFITDRIPRGCVIAPTRELCLQICEEAKKLIVGTNLRITSIYGGASQSYQKREIERGTDIVIGTPGRMLDFLDRKILDVSKTQILVLDEADRMLDMGFERDLKRILGYLPQNMQVLLFSATFSSQVKSVISRLFTDKKTLIEVENESLTSIKQIIIYAQNKREKEEKLLEILENCNMANAWRFLNGDRVLIFVETKRACRELEEVLKKKYRVVSLHGDKQQNEREAAVRSFKDGHSSVLIATSVAARGLDIKNITLVINFELPKDIKDYIHRIGRTGRAGQSGKAIAFFTEKDFDLKNDLMKVLLESKNEIPDFLKNWRCIKKGYETKKEEVKSRRDDRSKKKDNRSESRKHGEEEDMSRSNLLVRLEELNLSPPKDESSGEGWD